MTDCSNFLESPKQVNHLHMIVMCKYTPRYHYAYRSPQKKTQTRSLRRIPRMMVQNNWPTMSMKILEILYSIVTRNHWFWFARKEPFLLVSLTVLPSNNATKQRPWYHEFNSVTKKPGDWEGDSSGKYFPHLLVASYHCFVMKHEKKDSTLHLNKPWF